jgi:hypothetical protein
MRNPHREKYSVQLTLQRLLPMPNIMPKPHFRSIFYLIPHMVRKTFPLPSLYIFTHPHHRAIQPPLIVSYFSASIETVYSKVT